MLERRIEMKTTEEMLHTLASLGKPTIKYDFEGNFYVDIANVELQEGKMLCSFGEHKPTIHESVQATYEKLTTKGIIIVVGAYSDKRTEHTFRNGHFVLI
jgi:hypothetical protein